MLDITAYIAKGFLILLASGGAWVVWRLMSETIFTATAGLFDILFNLGETK